ncbi:MAG: NRDE family protein [Saprospiraceae bacterium]
MCTVSYLPVRDGFVLTHNRDEAPSRSLHGLARSGPLLFPKDAKAGGTWIATARSGRTACLLNGAFVKHRHQPPYRRSRGLVLLDFFEWPEPNDFFEQYDLNGIEPFTFLFLGQERIVELRWDGDHRHLAERPTEQPHFWCSATLYPPDMQVQREQVFRNWLGTDKHVTAGRLPAAIFRLHLQGSVGDPENDFVMNRAEHVRTVSVTQVVRRAAGASMRYIDLLNGGGAVRKRITENRQENRTI